MCGIVGYVGSRQALPILLDSLERVTYRGYDSFGIAVLNGRGIDLFKQVGPVDEQTGTFEMAGTAGIGHTRWATVGAVSNPDHQNINLGKAGRNRWLGRRPSVRGGAMNPVDPPHGGGEGRTSGGRHPVTPWGKPTKGKRTRSNKATDSMILRRRRKKK